MNEIKNSNKGFTLIELLVVVLIIGILAAIALPQYKLAVDKAEFRKYQSVVSSLRNAYDEYVLTHGKATKNFDDLSFTLPTSFENTNGNTYYAKCKKDNTMYCCMREYSHEYSDSYWSGEIYCGKKDENFSIVYREVLYYSRGKTARRGGRCLARMDNKRANRLCESIGKDKTGPLLIVDPVTGNSTGEVYNHYTLK